MSVIASRFFPSEEGEEEEWYPWLFPSVPRHFWAMKANQRWYCDWLGRLLGFKTPEDWYFPSLLYSFWGEVLSFLFCSLLSFSILFPSFLFFFFFK